MVSRGNFFIRLYFTTNSEFERKRRDGETERRAWNIIFAFVVVTFIVGHLRTLQVYVMCIEMSS